MILITGASQGIGIEVARALLARTDDTILLTGRCARRLSRARADLEGAAGSRVRIRVCDQGSSRKVRELAEEITSGGLPLAGAILGVGANPMYEEGAHRLHRVPASTLAGTIATNCTHATLLSGAILGQLARQRGGTLFWIGSQASHVGLSGAAVYCATKAFLGGMARAVALEYARYGIRASVLHPALVRTPRTAGVIDRFATSHRFPVHAADEVAKRIADLYCDPAGIHPEVDL